MWELFLRNRASIINQCLQLFKEEGTTEIALKLLIKKQGNKKSPKKLGYFFAEVLPKIAYGLKDVGYWEATEDWAEYYLRKQFLGENQLVNGKTGEVICEPRHISDLDDEEMGVFLKQCILHGSVDLMVRIATPEEWKEAHPEKYPQN